MLEVHNMSQRDSIVLFDELACVVCVVCDVNKERIDGDQNRLDKAAIGLLRLWYLGKEFNNTAITTIVYSWCLDEQTTKLKRVARVQ